ncbi:geranylgeranyl transferase type-1 subunit beta-like [Phragmites australis]|uniref:geranylgeranyl transferase type-1 subunit beta-like n=1 Tax=Phragmites australis TaxID=29695 RepID=UPI002D788256|nr:geranylgeranyl transferase type-1 subunit beta-like [Phragmites australis]
MGKPELAGFARAHHVAFFDAMATELPGDYATQEVNHLTLAYFAVAGLSLLRELDRVNKDQIAKWVLSFQVHPEANCDVDNGLFYGFCGSRSTQSPLPYVKDPCHNGSHLASTYSALAILKIVGYDLANIDNKALLLSMKKLQQPDGSFMPTHIGAETDLRFVYCAAAICSMLDDWTGMDKLKAKEYILNCQSYDGGFSMVPGSESHGGGTFCAVAALHLMGFIQVDLASNLRDFVSIDTRMLLEWCLQRQVTDGGFQGRRNKPSDTCYAFWVGGVLKIIGADHLIDHCALREFLLTCQSPYGGFTKFPYGRIPDIYHSYYGLAALSLLEEEGLEPLHVELGILSAALASGDPGRSSQAHPGGGVLFLLPAALPMAGVGSTVRRLYLSVYNWVVFYGWAQVLYYAILALLESGHEAVYAAVERPLQFAQTAAIMEILHGLVGLVRSPVSATLPQIGSRLFLTWGVLWSFPEMHSHILVTTLVISWSITEIIRYSFFGTKEALGFAPSWLLWLRYSTFMVLYPTGISSEVGLIFLALPYMKASEKYCLRLPNKWNFSFDYMYGSILAILVYVPGSPHMFGYMLAQRKKALSKVKTA